MIPTGPCVSVARATGLEPAANSRKHKTKRTSIALNREVGPQDRTGHLAQLTEVLSNLTPEDKALLAALLLGREQGGGQ